MLTVINITIKSNNYFKIPPQMFKPKLDHLPKNLSNFLFHLTGWSMIGVAVIDPFVYNFELKRSNLDPKQHKMLLFQEIVRQTINIGIDLLSFFAVGILVKTRLKNHPQKDLWQFVGGTMGNFMGKAFVRPIVTLKATSWWTDKYGEKPEQKTDFRVPLKVPPVVQRPITYRQPSYTPMSSYQSFPRPVYSPFYSQTLMRGVR